MGDHYPKFKAAAIQAAPVFLDRDATVEKACKLIEEAAGKGAKLIAFPEVFIPAYPAWNRLMPPFKARNYFLELVKNSVEVPSPSTEKICETARKANAYVVMGINEKVPETLGTLYNTNLVIDRKGKILGAHRKLMPTFVEKITWGCGDGHSLRVYDTDCGKIGTLPCSENGNSLARFALIAQGEQVHVANYPGFPAGEGSGYDLGYTIGICSAFQAFEGKLFNVVPSCIFTKEMADLLAETEEEHRMLSKGNNSLTAIYGPNGKCIAGPLDPNEEGMVIAEIDIEQIILQKLIQDFAGHYNRFDVLSLNLNRQHLKPIREMYGKEFRGLKENEETEQIKVLVEEIRDRLRSSPSASEKPESF